MCKGEPSVSGICWRILSGAEGAEEMTEARGTITVVQ